MSIAESMQSDEWREEVDGMNNDPVEFEDEDRDLIIVADRVSGS